MAKKRPSTIVHVPDIADQPAERTAPPSSYRTWMGILTLAVLLAILVGFWQYSENLIDTIDRQAGYLRQINAVLGARDLRMISLDDPSGFSGSSGTLLWNPETRAAFLRISDIPPASADSNYRLWFMHNGEELSSEILAVRGQRHLSDIFDLESTDFDSLLITLEPKEGPLRPSGPVILRGSFTSSKP